MRTLNSGTMGGDTGWLFRGIMFVVTIGGLFMVSILIGILSNGIESQMSRLRKGRSTRAGERPYRHPGLVAAGLHHHLRAGDRQREPQDRRRDRHPGRQATRSRWKRRSASRFADYEEHQGHLPLGQPHRPDRYRDCQPAYRALDHRPAAGRQGPRFAMSSNPSWRSPTTPTAARSPITS